MTLGARTRLLGVIGWPVEHSHSPAMHNAALAALGLDWAYAAFAVPPARLADAVAGARALGLRGLNVTLPHKQAVLDLCAPDAIARRVGAVNTLVFDESEHRDARPRGLNTDVHGFRRLCAEEGVAANGRRAAVLGAGGAARAVVIALREEGADVTVVSRSGRPLGLAADDEPRHVPWTSPSLASLLPSVALLVDATPRGLALDRDASPGTALDPDLSLLPPDAVVVDLVVRPVTPLVAAARARGLRAATGEGMLLHQGAAALEAWTGCLAPLDVMRAALARSIGR